MKVEWSQTAKRNYFSIAGYIKKEWGEKLVQSFRSDIREAIETIVRHPEAFPFSKKLNNRKLVVNNLSIIIYSIDAAMIYTEDFVNTKMNHPC